MFQVDSKWVAKKRKPKSSEAEVKTNHGKKAQKPSLIKNRRNHPLCFNAAHDEREIIYLDKKHLLQTLQA